MPLFQAHREAIHGDEFRGVPTLPFWFVTRLLQDLVEGAKVCARGKKAAHGVADVPASFLIGRGSIRFEYRACSACRQPLETENTLP